ncbi:hypothetical protein Sjap_017181 [Stephania japonica]|uniref:Uncharacterized protein n=1 Tax=Stephania japonica TaxID=461633 RepID=A0AAP0NLP6_9MAGN
MFPGKLNSPKVTLPLLSFGLTPPTSHLAVSLSLTTSSLCFGVVVVGGTVSSHDRLEASMLLAGGSSLSCCSPSSLSRWVQIFGSAARARAIYSVIISEDLSKYATSGLVDAEVVVLGTGFERCCDASPVSSCASVATLPGEILRDLCRIAVKLDHSWASFES